MIKNKVLERGRKIFIVSVLFYYLSSVYLLNFGFNYKNHLASPVFAQTPSNTVDFIYDGGGARIAKVVGGGDHTYYLSGGLEIVVKPDGTLTWKKNYSFTGGLSAVREKTPASETLSYIHQDHLGSTSQVTNTQGQIVGQQVYYPYGTTKATNGTLPTEHQYTGQISDLSQTGLYYYNARYYNPQIAKFTQPDSTGDTQNKYDYVSNNPINRIDPTGNADTMWDSGGGGSYYPTSLTNFSLDYQLAPYYLYNPLSINEQSAITITPDDYAHDPLLGEEYSEWREWVSFAPCSACHISHTFISDRIPTNEEIDENLMESYRALSPLTKIVHFSAFQFVSTLVTFTGNLSLSPDEIADLMTRKGGLAPQISFENAYTSQGFPDEIFNAMKGRQGIVIVDTASSGGNAFENLLNTPQVRSLNPTAIRGDFYWPVLDPRSPYNVINIPSYQGNIAKLPLATNSVDVLLQSNVRIYYEDFPQMLELINSEAMRVLKPGGLFLGGDWTTPGYYVIIFLNP